MNTWLFKTQRCAGPHIGEIPLWQGLISVRGTASLEEVAAIVAEAGYDPYEKKLRHKRFLKKSLYK